jgi:F-box-like
VLLTIFESFADAAPESVTRLLQVCQWWRAIAANAPRLWTHIKIKIKPTWDQSETAWKNVAMVESHLKRSASLPLHINLDLRDLLDQESQMEDYVDSGGDLGQLRHNARFFHFEDANQLLSEECGFGLISWIVSVLVGEDGMHMGRWKTARILLPPEEQPTERIWELFSGPTPQLTELLISSNRLWQRLLVDGDGGPVKFPDLSSLKALTLEESVVKDIDFLGLTFPSVKCLELAMDISYCSQLSLFTSLEYLDVILDSRSPADAVKAIYLPSLRDLKIHVYEPAAAEWQVEWHVPVLQTLKIVGSIDDESKALPNVQAVEVIWRLRGRYNLTGVEPELHRTLQTILSKYSDMQELTLHRRLEPIWEKYVRDLSKEKRLALPMVSIYH